MVSAFVCTQALAEQPHQASTFTKLKLSGLRQEAEGDPKSAESLYFQALAEAEKAGSNSRILEVLVRIVHVKAVEGQLKEGEPFYQRALNVAKSLKKKSGNAAEIATWLDDLADTYYTFGQYTWDQKTKEYCLEHYIISKMLSSDEYDPVLITKMNLLAASFTMQGHYADAIRINHDTQVVNDRFPNRPRVVGYDNGGPSSLYITLNKFELAEKARRDGFQIDCRLDPSHKGNLKGILERDLGTIQFEKGDLDAAESHFITARKIFRDYPKSACEEYAFEGLFMGLIQERKKNYNSAVQYFRESLDIYRKCPNSVPARKVLCMEHLADDLQISHKGKEAKDLRLHASKIRAQHPEWRSVSNPDPEKHLLLFGTFPYSIDIMPTRTKVNLF